MGNFVKGAQTKQTISEEGATLQWLTEGGWGKRGVLNISKEFGGKHFGLGGGVLPKTTPKPREENPVQIVNL